MFTSYQACLTLFLVLPVMATSLPAIREKQAPNAPLPTTEMLLATFSSAQRNAVPPPSIPTPFEKVHLYVSTSETGIQKRERVFPIRLHEPSPTESPTWRVTETSAKFQSLVHSSVAPHLPLHLDHNETTEMTSTAPIALASLELPLPSSLPLMTTSPSVETDAGPIPPEESRNAVFSPHVRSGSEGKLGVGSEGPNLFRRKGTKLLGGRLCSRCKKRSDCSGEFVCKERFCVRNRRQLERCERRVHCAPCGKGLPSCGKYGRCVKGVCIIEGQSEDACRRARRRALRKVHKKMAAQSYKMRNRDPVANLCDPCSHPAHCTGARFCSPGKPCRFLKCRAGFCSTSVRMSVRLCAKIDEF